MSDVTRSQVAIVDGMPAMAMMAGKTAADTESIGFLRVIDEALNPEMMCAQQMGTGIESTPMASGGEIAALGQIMTEAGAGIMRGSLMTNIIDTDLSAIDMGRSGIGQQEMSIKRRAGTDMTGATAVVIERAASPAGIGIVSGHQVTAIAGAAGRQSAAMQPRVNHRAAKPQMRRHSGAPILGSACSAWCRGSQGVAHL